MAWVMLVHIEKFLMLHQNGSSHPHRLRH